MIVGKGGRGLRWEFGKIRDACVDRGIVGLSMGFWLYYRCIAKGRAGGWVLDRHW